MAINLPDPYQAGNGIIQGLDTGSQMMARLIQNRLVQANTAAQLAKNPYVGPEEAANLQNQQNINKYYGQNIESEIGLRGAQSNEANQVAKWTGPKAQSDIALQNADAEIKRQQHDYPGLSGTGAEHEIATMQILMDKHPEIANQLFAQKSSAAAPDQSNQAPDISNAQPTAQPQLPDIMQKVISSSTPNNMTPVQGNQNPAMPNVTPVSMPAAQPQAPVAAQPQEQVAQPQAGFNPTDAMVQNINADIAEKQARAKFYGNGLGGGRGGVNIQNQRQLIADIQKDNPGFTDDQAFEASGNILSGKDTLNDGTPIQQSGLTTQAAINVQKTGATAAIKNQSAQLDSVVSDMKGVDIDALKAFTGLARIKLIAARKQMITNPDDPNIDPKARRFFTAMDQSILTMDQMRKAFGTSVVPDYVYNTVGKLANPNSSLWNDPKQVQQNWDASLKNMENLNNLMKAKVRGGVLASSPNTGNNNSSATTARWVRDKNGNLVRSS